MTTRAAVHPELERDLEKFFAQKIKRVGGITLKLVPTQSGAPDRLVLLPGGYLGLVELKTSSGDSHPIQRLWHSRAAALGIPVYVLHGRGEVISWLRTTFAREYDGEER